MSNRACNRNNKHIARCGQALSSFAKYNPEHGPVRQISNVKHPATVLGGIIAKTLARACLCERGNLRIWAISLLVITAGQGQGARQLFAC